MQSESLICGEMKLTVSPREKDGRFGYQLFVGDLATGWRAVSAAHNPLVRGDLLELYASEIEKAGDDCIVLTGGIQADDQSEPAAWRSTITADSALGWFAFDV